MSTTFQTRNTIPTRTPKTPKKTSAPTTVSSKSSAASSWKPCRCGGGSSSSSAVAAGPPTPQAATTAGWRRAKCSADPSWAGAGTRGQQCGICSCRRRRRRGRPPRGRWCFKELYILVVTKSDTQYLLFLYHCVTGVFPPRNNARRSGFCTQPLCKRQGRGNNTVLLRNRLRTAAQTTKF